MISYRSLQATDFCFMEFAMTTIIFRPIETSRLLLSDISFDNLNDAHRIYELYCMTEVHQYLAHTPPATFEEELVILLKQKLSSHNNFSQVWWIRKKIPSCSYYWSDITRCKQRKPTSRRYRLLARSSGMGKWLYDRMCSCYYMFRLSIGSH